MGSDHAALIWGAVSCPSGYFEKKGKIYYFFKHGPNLYSFYLFLSFSQCIEKNRTKFSKCKKQNGIRTQDSRMVGADEFTEIFNST